MAEKNKNNNSLVFADDGYLSYVDFSKLSFADKLRRRLNIAKVQFDNGSLAKAGYALVGGYDPENPRLSTGDVPNPGMRNPRLIVQGTLKIKQVAQKAKTIAERAAKISDRIFDRQYQRAISSGNSKRVLAVRDLHFKGKTGNDLVLTTYRSLFSNRKNESFGFNPYSDVRKARNHYGYFTTSSKDVANTYLYEENSPLFSVYTHMKNPYIVDANGRSWLAVEIFSPPGSTAKYGRTTDLVIKRVLSEGNNDGVIIKNIMDVGPKRANLNGASEIADDYVTFPGKAKLKDAITYDNNGNIIPISLRDNFLINDIRYKQGGKMNILEFLKNGSGIHIKEKNKGKFTSYCGGKVTDECIRKAKASGNPTLVKRATFAANTRKWKHKEGGIIKSLEGSKLTKALNSDLGKGLTNLVILGGAELWKSNLANSFSENFDKATDSLAKLMKKKSWGEKYNEALKFAPLYFQLNALDGVHYGVIDYQEFAKAYADSNIDLDSIEQFKYERELLKQNLLNAILGNSSVSDILLQGLGLVGNYLSNKSTKESTTNVGTTNVKTNSLGNDFSSGYNLFTKNSVLYNPDKFWSL